MVIEQYEKIKFAFPQLPVQFYDILSERLKIKNFTNKRLKDAVENLIDNCIYPIPTIANIISFDKRIKLYSYLDIIEMINQYGVNVFKYFKAIKTTSNLRWYALVADIETYNFELE